MFRPIFCFFGEPCPSPVCFSYFLSGVLYFCTDQLEPQSTYLFLLNSRDNRHATLHQAYWLRWDLDNFLFQLALNCCPSDDLYIPSSRDYRCESRGQLLRHFYIAYLQLFWWFWNKVNDAVRRAFCCSLC
jgi:hypothetical protein